MSALYNDCICLSCRHHYGIVGGYVKYTSRRMSVVDYRIPVYRDYFVGLWRERII